jgi:hypothetical protein
VPRPAVTESAFARSIAWATGKKLWDIEKY